MFDPKPINDFEQIERVGSAWPFLETARVPPRRASKDEVLSRKIDPTTEISKLVPSVLPQPDGFVVWNPSILTDRHSVTYRLNRENDFPTHEHILPRKNKYPVKNEDWEVSRSTIQQQKQPLLKEIIPSF